MATLTVQQSFVDSEGWRGEEPRPSVFVHGAALRDGHEVASYSVSWAPDTEEPITSLITVYSGRVRIDLAFWCVGVVSTLASPREFKIVDPETIWVEPSGESVPASSADPEHVELRRVALEVATAAFRLDPTLQLLASRVRN